MNSGLLAQERKPWEPVWVDSATYSMNASEQLVFVNSTPNNVDITLPDVRAAAGLFYTIKLKDAGANDLDILVGDGALGKTAVEALDPDADNDTVVLYSDGEEWHIIRNGIA